MDVFPVEPASNAEQFRSPLQGLDNVILTPHVGGSTEEAQERIGAEVARKLVDYSDVGSTVGAVNFPQAQLPARPTGTRYIHVHRNVPGTLGPPQQSFRAAGPQHRGAVPADRRRDRLRRAGGGPGRTQSQAILDEIRAFEGTIRARLLYQRS